MFEFVSSKNTGVNFLNSIENTSSLNILNYLYFYNGAGVATGDFNSDGLPDIYFTANQTADKLYLNKGNFKFEDITEKSLAINNSGWTTGVTTVDINNDGLLDIYVCKVGEYRSIKGTNLLFVNQGTNENGIPSFKEEAQAYGLDISSFSTQAAFFDYDQDNDLDLFLLNHSVHPNRTYGKGAKRKLKDDLSGDRLYENHNGKFTDVSAEAGVFQGNIGYGLGLAIGDLNNDSHPDIYIGNDFFENDYLYSNNQDKTFTELINEEPLKLGHTTHYSMGNTIADINNDGLLDIYVSQIGDYEGIKGHNQLYVCQRIQDGIPRYEDQAAYYGLDFVGFSTQASFFDYDHDGDLDCYLLNNSYQAIGSFNLRKNERPNRDEVGGDKLLRNDGGKFTRVTEEAGMLQY